MAIGDEVRKSRFPIILIEKFKIIHLDIYMVKKNWQFWIELNFWCLIFYVFILAVIDEEEKTDKKKKKRPLENGVLHCTVHIMQF